ncbi:MAG: hypothetical protein PHW04_09325 [Candidatus Wallbacteria bacterium]|nr:hypothetical protein [Candidatus Wallbacteria bacterium]
MSKLKIFELHKNHVSEINVKNCELSTFPGTYGPGKLFPLIYVECNEAVIPAEKEE